jgi:hypothetical protein
LEMMYIRFSDAQESPIQISLSHSLSLYAGIFVPRP